MGGFQFQAQRRRKLRTEDLTLKDEQSETQQGKVALVPPLHDWKMGGPRRCLTTFAFHSP